MAGFDDSVRFAWLFKIASIAIVVAALYLAKGLLVPFTLAVLLSFLLAPCCDWLERYRLARVPSVLVTALFAFFVLGMLAWSAMLQMTDLAQRLPEYQDNIEAKLQSANDFAAGALNKLLKTTERVQDIATQELAPEAVANQRSYPVRVVASPPNALQIAGGVFGPLVEILGSAGIVIVFVIFFLVRREDLRDRFIRLVGQGQMMLTTQALQDAAARVSRYLSTQLIINVVFGILVFLGLYFIGVPNAVLWGLFSGVLRFVPYLGVWIAASMPMLVTLAISPSWYEPTATIVMFLVLELIVSNVAEPWLYGRNTGVSPVAVLVAAVFWTWLWGAIGLLLATPLAVCLVVIGKYVPQLSFLNTILGDEPVFEPPMHVYQRLLAGDHEEAADVVDEFVKKSSLGDAYDTLLIPALAMAENDHHRGDLADWRHRAIIRGIRDIVEDFAERRDEPEDSVGDESSRSVPSALASRSTSVRLILLPANDDADELAAVMLGQLLSQNGYVAEVIPPISLVSEMLDQVAEYQANVVCISAMPPAAMTHARYLCKRLRGRFPDLSLVVALWNMRDGLTKIKQRLGANDEVRISVTLAEAQEEIRLASQSLFLRLSQPRSSPGAGVSSTSVSNVSG